MKKLFLLTAIVAIAFNSFSQNLQSPEQYLGYGIGKKYTRHHKIVEYFKAVATAKKDMVITEKYGETNEGRELMLAYISTPENIAKLESIKKVGVGLIITPELQYQLSKKISISAMPYFKYSLGPINKGNVVKTYPYTFGLGIGAVYKF